MVHLMSVCDSYWKSKLCSFHRLTPLQASSVAFVLWEMVGSAKYVYCVPLVE